MIFDKLDLNRDYQNIKKLWENRNHPIADINFLSPYGCVAFNDNKLVGVVFLYLTLNTPIYMLRFPVVDNSLTKELHEKAINGLIDNSELLAKGLGYTISLCSTNHFGLIKRLENKKYIKEFSDCVHLTKGV